MADFLDEDSMMEEDNGQGPSQPQSVFAQPPPSGQSVFMNPPAVPAVAAQQTSPVNFSAQSNNVTLDGGGPSSGFRATSRVAQRQAGLPDNKFFELKAQRPALMQQYIAEGKMMDPEKKYRLEEAFDIVGTCQDMCPEFERHEREAQHSLQEWEKIPGTEFVNHKKAVKRYRRAAADDPKPMPCDLRPPKVLMKTLNYLFYDLMLREGLEKTYSFVRDRTRSIRTDLQFQNIKDMQSVEIHEPIARFHLVACHQLCEAGGVDFRQELEQLRKTLQSLFEMYPTCREQHNPAPNEAEFTAYYLLTHVLDGKVPSKVHRHLEKAPHVRDHPYMLLAWKIHKLISDAQDDNVRDKEKLNAFYQFFATIADRGTPYLVACAVHPSLPEIRKMAIRKFNWRTPTEKGRLETYPALMDVVKRFGYDNEEKARDDLERYGSRVLEFQGRMVVEIGRDIVVDPVTGRRTVPRDSPGTFDGTKGAPKATVEHRLIEAKLGRGLGKEELLNTFLKQIGGEVPELAEPVPDPVPTLSTATTPTAAQQPMQPFSGLPGPSMNESFHGAGPSMSQQQLPVGQSVFQLQPPAQQSVFQQQPPVGQSVFHSQPPVGQPAFQQQPPAGQSAFQAQPAGPSLFQPAPAPPQQPAPLYSFVGRASRATHGSGTPLQSPHPPAHPQPQNTYARHVQMGPPGLSHPAMQQNGANAHDAASVMPQQPAVPESAPAAAPLTAPTDVPGVQSQYQTDTQMEPETPSAMPSGAGPSSFPGLGASLSSRFSAMAQKPSPASSASASGTSTPLNEASAGPPTPDNGRGGPSTPAPFTTQLPRPSARPGIVGHMPSVTDLVTLAEGESSDTPPPTSIITFGSPGLPSTLFSPMDQRSPVGSTTTSGTSTPSNLASRHSTFNAVPSAPSTLAPLTVQTGLPAVVATPTPAPLSIQTGLPAAAATPTPAVVSTPKATRQSPITQFFPPIASWQQHAEPEQPEHPAQPAQSEQPAQPATQANRTQRQPSPQVLTPPTPAVTPPVEGPKRDKGKQPIRESQTEAEQRVPEKPRGSSPFVFGAESPLKKFGDGLLMEKSMENEPAGIRLREIVESHERTVEAARKSREYREAVANIPGRDDWGTFTDDDDIFVPTRPRFNIAEIALPCLLKGENFKAEAGQMKIVSFKLAISFPVERYSTTAGLRFAHAFRKWLGIAFHEQCYLAGNGSEAKSYGNGMAKIGDVQCTSIVQEVKVDMREDVMRRDQPNSEALCSGTNVAFFQFAVLDEEFDANNFWEYERRRFQGFMKTLPSQAQKLGHKIPLILLHWAIPENVEGFESTAKDVLWQGLTEDEVPFNNLIWINIPTGGNRSVMDYDLREKLATGIEKAAEVCPLAPEIKFGAYHTKLEHKLMDEWEKGLTDTIQMRFPSSSAMHLTRNAITFNVIVNNFNDCLRAFEEIVAGVENETVGFPAGEFKLLGDKVEVWWNARERLEKFRGLLGKFRFPEMTVATGEIPELEEKGKDLKDVVRPIWRMYYWFGVRFGKALDLPDKDIFQLMGDLHNLFWEYCGKDLDKAPFPFERLAHFFIRHMLTTLEATFQSKEELNKLAYCPNIAHRHTNNAVNSMNDRITEWIDEYVVGWKSEVREEEPFRTPQEKRSRLEAQALGLPVKSEGRKSWVGVDDDGERRSPGKRKMTYNRYDVSPSPKKTRLSEPATPMLMAVSPSANPFLKSPYGASPLANPFLERTPSKRKHDGEDEEDSLPNKSPRLETETDEKSAGPSQTAEEKDMELDNTVEEQKRAWEQSIAEFCVEVEASNARIQAMYTPKPVPEELKQYLY
ncbi:hypothetical protein HK097_007137 [Rhizophlyctis rosea]|uniref:SAC3/GANP/THP3 conserved domain-containing protein n=1 Tax=Rhizophlyctis rosea TaxID=64517 RepID=A0AAD5SDX4_9FUNG|nr:hypothetical protein HK097_007137 [Rhizophlyctis rosea]